MRYSTLFLASVVLALFGVSFGQGQNETYQNINQYVEDIPVCVRTCYDFLVFYYQHTCSNGVDLKCVCETPEPDLTDPVLAQAFGEAVACTQNCSVYDQTRFAAANNKLTDTCEPYYSVDGEPTTASHGYYETALGTYHTVLYPSSGSGSAYPTAHNITGSFSGPTPTGSGAPVITGSVTAVSNATLSSTSVGIAQQTANSADWNVKLNWQMTIGLPMIASLVLSFGVQFL